MRHLLLLLLALPCFGQGFGSFSHDQPFLSKDASAYTPSYLPVGVAYYWTFTNLNTNVGVSAWTDVIQSHQLKSAGESNPTNTTNGLYFTTYLSGSWYNQLLTNDFLTTGSNVVVGFVIKPEDKSGSARYETLFVREQAETAVAIWDDQVLNNGTARFTMFSTEVIIPAYTYTNVQDISFYFSNTPSAKRVVGFVDGQSTGELADSEPAHFVNGTNFAANRWFGQIGGNTLNFRGHVLEVLVWTNTGNWGGTHASNFHAYRTNTYGGTP